MDTTGFKANQHKHLCFYRFQNSRGCGPLLPMTRRLDLEPEFVEWMAQIALNLRSFRLARGWTQLQAAERCGIDYKQFQAIEYGRARMTLHTLFRLAQGFGTPPAELLTVGSVPPAATAPRRRRAPSRWRSLTAAGWHVRSVEPKRGQRFPLYDLTAAAGPPGTELARPEIAAWATAPRRLGKLTGDFLIQVRGASMEPLVTDGDWCLLRRSVDTPLVGKVVLVAHGGEGGDDDTAWQLKRVGAVAYDDEDGQLEVRLDSANRAFAPAHVRVRQERDLHVLGELVRVVASPHADPL